MSAVGNKERMEFPHFHLACSVEDKRAELAIAVTEGNLEVVKLLLDQGADVSPKNYFTLIFEELIHIAIKYDNFEIVTLLLEHGADGYYRKKYSCTPLGVAVHKGNIEIIRALISKGADVNSRDKYGRAPLDVAVDSGNLEIVRLLIDKGADVNSRDNYGRPPLGVATLKDNIEIVSLLLDKGADINSTDPDGNTPVCLALGKQNMNILVLLVGKGAGKNLAMRNWTIPLDADACQNNVEIARLLDHGIDANLTITAALKMYEDYLTQDYPRFLREYTVILSSLQLTIKRALVQNPNAEKPEFYGHQIWSNYWNMSKDQINDMKNQKMGHSIITFYEFLVSDEHQLESLVKNKYVAKEINNGGYKFEFPFYANEIKAQYEIGIKRKTLLDAGLAVVARFPSWPEAQLPADVVSLFIVQYLDNNDLQNLKEARTSNL